MFSLKIKLTKRVLFINYNNTALKQFRPPFLELNNDRLYNTSMLKKQRALLGVDNALFYVNQKLIFSNTFKLLRAQFKILHETKQKKTNKHHRTFFF
jgi:hypothetical protein